MLWDISGRKLEVGKLGDAFIVKAWIDGVALYNAFGSVQAIHAWVEDMGKQLDTFEHDIDTLEIAA